MGKSVRNAVRHFYFFGLFRIESLGIGISILNLQVTEVFYNSMQKLAPNNFSSTQLSFKCRLYIWRFQISSMLFSAFYRKRWYIRGRIERFSIMWLSIVVKIFWKMMIYQMRAPRHIILTYSSLFLFFNARLFVTTSWLRIYSRWVSKSRRPTENERKSPNYGLWCIRI